MLELAEDERTIVIKYEGLDADRHQIDLDKLGESLRGFARILAVCGHFAETGKYNKQFNALSVKVLTTASPREGSYEVVAYVSSLLAQPELWSGVFGSLLTLTVQYVLSRRDKEEMKFLKESLDNAVNKLAEVAGREDKSAERLLSIIERMTDALTPAAKQAMAPIGTSCESISIVRSGTTVAKATQETKDTLNQDITEITPATSYMGVFSELDLVTGACKVTLGSDEARTSGQVTDPILTIPNNPYALALASGASIKFRAKAGIDEDGNITKLYISELEY